MACAICAQAATQDKICDRSFEQQCYRASGLNLVSTAIVLWNTAYLKQATQALREASKLTDNGMLRYLSPLGLEHIEGSFCVLFPDEMVRCILVAARDQFGLGHELCIW